MKKIILDLAVTLDGFIEGPNGEIDWCIMEEGEGNDFIHFLNGIDTIFYGRVSYDMWGNWQPDETMSKTIREAYAIIHQQKKYVFSSTRKSDEGQATFISSDIARHVQEIRQQPGKDIWLYGGGKLIHTFMKLGLVDIFRLAVHPVLLGAGKPLFSGIKERVGLELANVKTSPAGVAMMTYVRK
ncbi:dihydrofolate reductase family protein [Chitinophaga pendula]|uniref:dihydrofolate reductase family protein n=1 Tax=Chitinophaga TaxID=79328 RepID=UPI000BB0BD74|nr:MULTISPECIES: dihydrofolate reductase family protein [Chitinophaga]ASZ14908.1 hypothetical protein CK934_11335 [Chitinophaga sp. MD30]UCJ05483.1 dihydrofolate reductase family protein [Chitinophaga pendula]